MQNFTECARRHCTVSKKLIRPALKHYTGKHSDSNKTLRSSSCKIWTDRLFNSVKYHVPPIVSRDFQVISSFFLRNSFTSTHNIFGTPGFYSVRYFHVTRASGCRKEPKKDEEKKPEQDEKSDKEDKSNKEDPNKKFTDPSAGVPFIIHMFVIGIASSLAYLFASSVMDTEEIQNMMNVPWNEFEHQMLAKGEVEKIIVYNQRNTAVIQLRNDAIVMNKKHKYKFAIMIVPDIQKMEDKIKAAEDRLGIPYSQRVTIVYAESWRGSGLIMLTIALFLLSFFASKGRRENFASRFRGLNPVEPKFTLIKPSTGKGIKFSDVAGLAEAKVEVIEFVEYLKRPDRYRAIGAKVPKGALLLGPPGCGKTMLAKAVATESNVPFFSMNGCEFIELYGGLGAARVRNLFKEAKEQAPAIIYIDEIDAFGATRATNVQASGESETERTLVQLLVEMDGMSTRDDVIVLASTNRSEILDKALLRPGRLDRHILIDLPTQIERKQIFQKHLASITLHHRPSDYADYLASVTQGFTGADIANVCNEAALHAARLNKKKVYGSDLMYAIERSRTGTTKISNAMSPEEKRIIAYREAGFALLTWMLEHTNAVAKISIVPTTSGSFSNTQLFLESNRTLSLRKIEDLTCAYLGGRVAENIVFGYMTNVTMDQLKKATKLVYKQVMQYGMSPTVGLITFEPDQYKKGGRKPFSKKLSRLMDAEVRRIISDASDRAKLLLTKHRTLLNTLAEELVKKETLYYDAIEKLIGPPPYPKQRPQLSPDFMSEEEFLAEVPKPETKK